jgi:hypothetical protein
MKQATIAVTAVLCMAATTACGRNREIGVLQTGCLTQSGDQFVLTDLERREGGAATETFQLIGNEKQLRELVGQQVRVSGQAEPADVAVMKESTPPPSEPAPAGTTGGSDPKVSSETETRVEARRLTVSAIEATGSSCAAEIKSGAGSEPPRP